MSEVPLHTLTPEPCTLKAEAGARGGVGGAGFELNLEMFLLEELWTLGVEHRAQLAIVARIYC